MDDMVDSENAGTDISWSAVGCHMIPAPAHYLIMEDELIWIKLIWLICLDGKL